MNIIKSSLRGSKQPLHMQIKKYHSFQRIMPHVAYLQTQRLLHFDKLSADSVVLEQRLLTPRDDGWQIFELQYLKP